MYKTVRDGEQALLVDKHGRVTVVDGPHRVNVWSKTFQRLHRVSADQKQYIRLQHKDGRIEHLHGPCSIFMNPMRMDFAEVKQSYALDANEVLVIYARDQESGGVMRRIQHGPTVYTPSADEWLHHFVWHGTDRNHKTQKLPGRLQFEKLRVIPDQFYYNIDDVRTKDDALIVVKLMIFFELRDIETMLNQTTDPIGDFVNAVQADVVAFASQLTYEEFMDASAKLNTLDHYPSLLERSKKIGYAVTKVVFRGYQASDKLQQLHDKAVEKRTKLRVKMESEQQQQDLTDSKLLNEQQRSVIQKGLEMDSAKHRHSMEKEQLSHHIKLEEKAYKRDLERQKDEKMAELDAEKKTQTEELAHLRELKKLGVDVTSYLVSQHPRPDQVTRVVTVGPGAAVHVHP